MFLYLIEGENRQCSYFFAVKADLFLIFPFSEEGWDDYHAPLIQIRPLRKYLRTDGKTDEPTEQRTDKASYKDVCI